jgi:peptidoglycan/xylan/chitin deacetylase (PgdA/CDA1 family)
MHRSGLCYFGSHAHRHAILTSLPDAELKVELTKPRTILEDIVGGNFHSIGSPNGNADERVKLASRDTGFRYGYTTGKDAANVYTEGINRGVRFHGENPVESCQEASAPEDTFAQLKWIYRQSRWLWRKTQQ